MELMCLAGLRFIDVLLFIKLYGFCYNTFL